MSLSSHLSHLLFSLPLSPFLSPSLSVSLSLSILHMHMHTYTLILWKLVKTSSILIDHSMSVTQTDATNMCGVHCVWRSRGQNNVVGLTCPHSHVKFLPVSDHFMMKHFPEEPSAIQLSMSSTLHLCFFLFHWRSHNWQCSEIILGSTQRTLWCRGSNPGFLHAKPELGPLEQSASRGPACTLLTGILTSDQLCSSYFSQSQTLENGDSISSSFMGKSSELKDLDSSFTTTSRIFHLGKRKCLAFHNDQGPPEQSAKYKKLIQEGTNSDFYEECEEARFTQWAYQ